MADEQDNDTPDTDVAQATQETEATPVAEAVEQTSAPAPSAAPAEPAEQLSPKERRRKARSTHSGGAREGRTPQERQAERDAERRRKAVRRRARRQQERAKRSASRESAGGAGAPAPAAADREPGTRKVRQGIVVSDKADKTITVRIDVARRHRRYEKIVRSSNTLHAHDESNDAHEGDIVRVVESRPLSRTKRWRLVDVLERAR